MIILKIIIIIIIIVIIFFHFSSLQGLQTQLHGSAAPRGVCRPQVQVRRDPGVRVYIQRVVLQTLDARVYRPKCAGLAPAPRTLQP
jgi:hypothetical protein